MINYLYTATLDLSLIIGLVLLLRPLVRPVLGAHAAYSLWVLVIAMVIAPNTLSRPDNAIDSSIGSLPISAVTNELGSVADVLFIPGSIPILEIWLAGLLVCAFIQIGLQYRFSRSLRRDSAAYGLQEEKLRRLVDLSGIAAERIRISPTAQAPMIVGLLPATVYLPEDFGDAYSAEEKYWALIHELTHYRRKDLWAQFVAEVLRIGFWFNPLMHLAIRCFREDQEMSCDQSVLAKRDLNDRVAYGRALMRSSSLVLVPSALTFFTRSKERYLMLKHHKSSAFNSVVTFTLCLGIAVFTLTSAPSSIAQSERRPAFDDVYDANLPKTVVGKIRRVDYAEHIVVLHVDAEREDGAVTSWVVEGASYQEMHSAGLDSIALHPGRPVTVTGYQSKDQACSPACKLHGRDITFDD